MDAKGISGYVVLGKLFRSLESYLLTNGCLKRRKRKNRIGNHPYSNSQNDMALKKVKRAANPVFFSIIIFAMCFVVDASKWS